MPHVSIQLPKGELGLVLAPVQSSDSFAVGCQIKGWKSTPKVDKVTAGSKIISIDGNYVENLPFTEMVSRIRNSKDRVIVLDSPKKLFPPQDKENDSPNTSQCTPDDVSFGDLENLRDCLDTPLSPSSSLSNSIQSRTPSKLHVSGNKSASGSSPNTVISNLKKENMKKDAMMLMLQGQIDKTSQQLQASRDASKQLEEKLAHQEYALTSAKLEVDNIKGSKRGSDGQIALLQYRLDRIQSKQANSTSSRDMSLVGGDSRIALLSHSIRFRDTLDKIRSQKLLTSSSSSSSPPALKNTDSTSQTVAQELEYQKRLSHRLEMQLRYWVDGQISLHKQLALEDCKVGNKDLKSLMHLIGDEGTQQKPVANAAIQYSSDELSDDVPCIDKKRANLSYVSSVESSGSKQSQYQGSAYNRECKGSIDYAQYDTNRSSTCESNSKPKDIAQASSYSFSPQHTIFASTQSSLSPLYAERSEYIESHFHQEKSVVDGQKDYETSTGTSTRHRASFSSSQPSEALRAPHGDKYHSNFDNLKSDGSNGYVERRKQNLSKQEEWVFSSDKFFTKESSSNVNSGERDPVSLPSTPRSSFDRDAYRRQQPQKSPVLSPREYRQINYFLPPSSVHVSRQSTHPVRCDVSKVLHDKENDKVVDSLSSEQHLGEKSYTHNLHGTERRRSRSIREQMDKLRRESSMIRSDLNKFRSTLKEVRDECGTDTRQSATSLNRQQL